jgi:hypothetical protein
LKICTLLLLSLICTYTFATSYPPPPPITFIVPANTAICKGFKVADTDDLKMIEVEYPKIMDNKLTPDSIVIDYYKNNELLFTSYSTYKETSKTHSIYAIFHKGLKNNDASISVGYKCKECNSKQTYVYKIKSVNDLYKEHKKTNACH